MANITFFKAVEIIVRDKGMNIKQAEAYLKTKLAEQALALVTDAGEPIAEEAFALNLSKLE